MSSSEGETEVMGDKLLKIEDTGMAATQQQANTGLQAAAENTATTTQQQQGNTQLLAPAEDTTTAAQQQGTTEEGQLGDHTAAAAARQVGTEETAEQQLAAGDTEEVVKKPRGTEQDTTEQPVTVERPQTLTENAMAEKLNRLKNKKKAALTAVSKSKTALIKLMRTEESTRSKNCF